MTRRTLILLPVAAALWADDASKAWDLLADAASALSQGNSVYFLSLCDSKSPAFQALRSNIGGLLGEMEVQSSIDPVTNQGDENRRTIDVDWSMRLVPINRGANPVARRQVVKCVMERRGRKWLIESLEPAAFFALPKEE
jgi:hypothetical protein